MVTFRRVDPTDAGPIPVLTSPEFETRISNTLSSVFAEAERMPPHCNLPENNSDAVALHEFVVKHLSEHCVSIVGLQSTGCGQFKTIDILTPFMSEVIQYLVEDYAWSRGWCFVKKGFTDIPMYPPYDAEVQQLKAYQRNHGTTNATRGSRLIFLITAYTDPPQVMRLLTRLHSPRHLYIVVVDRSHQHFAQNMTESVRALGENVVVLTPLAVVYMASSATRVLVHGMSWILDKFDGWDYLVSLTGTDYPLLTVAEMEAKLSKRNPPMPSLLIWQSARAYDAAFRSFDGRKDNASMCGRLAAAVLKEERVLPSVSERRGVEQYGMPLTDENQKIYMRYTARQKTQVSELCVTLKKLQHSKLSTYAIVAVREGYLA